MENMVIYNKYAEVPESAKKTIRGGRLNGLTDINPMWRIRSLTEMFGPCGVGWRPQIVDKHIEEGANGERIAVVDVNLFVKIDGEWSEAIPGTGGASFVAKEKNGLYTSDEAYKMAYTDALSVCCKLLGFGANVYWAGGRTKYSGTPPKELPAKAGWVDPPEGDAPVICDECGARFRDYWDGHDLIKAADLARRSVAKFGKRVCTKCARTLDA